VLLGDSIFDNGAYTSGGPDVIAQLRSLVPTGWKATLLAIDGARTEDVARQLDRLPPDASHLVLSIGGNDALAHSELLEGPAASAPQLLGFLADAAEGTLPHVSFVEPRFLGEEFGVSSDDHPFADVRNGQAFLNQVYRAVTTSPAWPNTVLVINYDEWGGFFDHVPPGTAPIPPADELAGNRDGRLGFRTPCFVVSPFARREFVSHRVFDHTSILKMIEWRWGLDPLTVRDAAANNLAEALDFTAPDPRAKSFNVPAGPFGGLCLPGVPDETDGEWLPLLSMAALFGWPVRSAVTS